MAEEYDYASAFLADMNTKMVDIEEKQRLLKDRVLLIGDNLVNARQETNQEIAQLKVSVEQIKQDTLKIRDTLQRILDELDTKARKSELEMLQRQAQMFQPLELARMEDVKKLLKEKR